MTVDTTITRLKGKAIDAIPRKFSQREIHPLNDQAEWMRRQDFTPPLTAAELKAVQDEIDSIAGVTRENQSIIKLVWNGDIEYWKAFHTAWVTATGHPYGPLYRRPRLLYRTIRSSGGKFIRDVYVPRYLLLTRIEPEQYAATYDSDSKIYHPDLKMKVQYLPAECPPVQYVWYMTIAEHDGHCCGLVPEGTACNGKYAHPRLCLPLLRNDRKGMEDSGVAKSNPFDSPDRIARRIRDNMTNDYANQTMKEFRRQADESIDQTPFAMADPVVASKVSSPRQLKEHLLEESKRSEDALEKQLKAQNNEQ